MPTVTPWDVRIVNAATLTPVAYVPHWESLQFGDALNSPGHGAVHVDYDEPWLAAFNTANSAYPWEGNYAIQVLRSGTLVFTFIIEEAEIEYAGLNRRRAVMGGRGIAACLEWAITLPGGFDESQADPDALIVSGGMSRGFGNTHDTQTELDDETYSVDNPKYKAFGGAAFVYLFKEADTGNAGTADTADSYAISTANRSGGVDWPLSLDTAGGGMSETKDGASTPVDWSDNSAGNYEDLDVTWLFEIPSGQNMFETLTYCTEITANSQWRVAPDGKISIAKAVGDSKVGTVLLTVPNATMSTNQLHRKDLRTTMFGSNGYSFEKATSDAAITNIYGRREMYLSADQAHGETVLEAAKQALKDVEDTLDEFTFGYIETDTTQAWLDFTVGDTVRIEYESGRVQDRQVTGLSASLTESAEKVEVTIGDVVENAFARLAQEEATGQPSWQIDIPAFHSQGKPIPPMDVVPTAATDGMDRSVEIAFKQSRGWENEIAMYEAEVWKA